MVSDDVCAPTIHFPLAQRDDPLGFTTLHIVVRSLSGSPVCLTRSVAAALMAVTHRPSRFIGSPTMSTSRLQEITNRSERG
jgi:hypothetical protein